MSEAGALPALLEIDRFSVGYTDEPVVVELSATIPAGCIATIIGPNGAGKSTLLRGIYGLNRHFGGSLRFLGQPIEALHRAGACGSASASCRKGAAIFR